MIVKSLLIGDFQSDFYTFLIRVPHYLCLFLDLYLARLITSKQIIQPYVDQFFNSILLNQPGAQIPPPIKYLFDFLDQDAIQSLNNQLHNQHNTTLNNVSFRRKMPLGGVVAKPLVFGH